MAYLRIDRSLLTLFGVGLAAQLAGVWTLSSAEAMAPGLIAAFSAPMEGTGVSKDFKINAGIGLYVPAGESPTPFLAAGPFQAEWTGKVRVDLRSDMFFQAECQGAFALEINGALVLEHTGKGDRSALSKAVRLNKGLNGFEARLSSPSQGDTWVRLWWGEEEGMLMPVPATALGHDPLAEPSALRASRQRVYGRELSLEHRCFKCHAVATPHPVPELAMDAPSFEGIGARRRYAWMVRWIENPRAMRASARMPVLAHGTEARADAQAMAAFLASQTQGGEVSIPEPPSQPVLVAGSAEPNEAVQGAVPKTLFEALHCQACHSPPNATGADPGSISLQWVAQKFADGKLVEFLRQPEAHYRWIGMPNFRLSTKEAKELAQFLLPGAPPPPSDIEPINATIIDRGRELVQTSGCLHCHKLNLENRHQAPAFLSLKRWEAGCLAEKPGADTVAPQFGFAREQREALRAFAQNGIESLGRHVASEFAERQTELLNCRGCHGRFDGFPSLDVVGGRLKPAWMERYLSGGLPYRPRPWLYSRMPVFQERARSLAWGLAMGHGYGPVTAAEPPVRAELAEAGRQLVGKEGGFSCVSCHAIGTQKATEVFEAEGINLSYAAARLQPSYYRRWLLNPTLIEPQSKMPVYFDRGASPLTEVLDGNADRQMEAMWEYFRMQEALPAPLGGKSR